MSFDFHKFFWSVLASKDSSNGFNNFLMISISLAPVFWPYRFRLTIDEYNYFNSWTLSSILRFCDDFSVRPHCLNRSFKIECCTSISSSSAIFDFDLFYHLWKLIIIFPIRFLLNIRFFKVTKEKSESLKNIWIWNNNKKNLSIFQKQTRIWGKFLHFVFILLWSRYFSF